MSRIKEFIKQIKIIDVLVYFLLVVLMVFCISKKVNYHIDETLSYGLANYSEGYLVQLDFEKRYEPASEPFIEYLSVRPNNRSNLNIAWSNQANDCHPPFYYALLHIVCALKVNTFSNWFAGSINTVFGVLTLFVIRRISKLLTNNSIVTNLVSYGFALSYGIVSDSALFRMYYMSLFFVSLSTYLIMLQNKKNIGIWFYLLITISVITGTLTHYYCLLFNIIISTVYCLHLLKEKKWKEVLLYSFCMAIAAGITIGIFPAIIRHLFKTGHANDAFVGIRDFGQYFSRIATCFSILSEMMFGKLLILILITVIVIMYVKRSKNSLSGYSLITISSIVFFLLISITATYTTERYLMPIFANLFCVIMCLFYTQLETIINNKKTFLVVSLSCLIAMTSFGYYKAKWEYLYLEDAEHLEKAALHSDADCICIHEDLQTGWEIQLNFNEYVKYKSFTLFGKGSLDLDKLSNYFKGDEVIINLVCITDRDKYLQEIKNALPMFDNIDFIGQKGNNYSYCLFK